MYPIAPPPPPTNTPSQPQIKAHRIHHHIIVLYVMEERDNNSRRDGLATFNEVATIIQYTCVKVRRGDMNEPSPPPPHTVPPPPPCLCTHGERRLVCMLVSLPVPVHLALCFPRKLHLPRRVSLTSQTCDQLFSSRAHCYLNENRVN